MRWVRCGRRGRCGLYGCYGRCWIYGPCGRCGPGSGRAARGRGAVDPWGRGQTAPSDLPNTRLTLCPPKANELDTAAPGLAARGAPRT